MLSPWGTRGFGSRTVDVPRPIFECSSSYNLINTGSDEWLTVVSPDEPDGTEFLVEPNANEAAATFQRAMCEQGIPLTSFAVDNIEDEHARLKSLGVKFTTQPTDVGGAIVAAFDDTCGNLIQIYQT